MPIGKEKTSTKLPTSARLSITYLFMKIFTFYGVADVRIENSIKLSFSLLTYSVVRVSNSNIGSIDIILSDSKTKKLNNNSDSSQDNKWNNEKLLITPFRINKAINFF